MLQAYKMGERPYTAEEMAGYSRSWKQEFRRRQRQRFKQDQLKRAKDEGYWDFVFGDVLG